MGRLCTWDFSLPACLRELCALLSVPSVVNPLFLDFSYALATILPGSDLHFTALYYAFRDWGPKFMKATFHPGVHKFSLFVVAWAAVLLTAGALVTSEDAALAVPDWPLSYGTLNPPMVGGIAFEHSHRLIAASLGILIIVLAFLLWRYEERPSMKWLGFAALGGVILQGVLGGLTVLQLLHYWLPVMHACLAQIMFAILVSIALFTSHWYMQDLPQYADTGAPPIHTIVTLNAFVIFLQVLVGAGFRHKYLSLKPHVFGAPIVLAMVIWTASVLRRRFPEVKEIGRIRKLLHSIVGLQVLLGLVALWARINSAGDPQPLPPVVISTVIHTVVGAVLFAISIITVLVCYRLVPRNKEVLFATTKGEVPA
jgi:heme a synthase